MNRSKASFPESHQTVEAGKAEQEHCRTELGAQDHVDAYGGIAAILVASQYAA